MKNSLNSLLIKIASWITSMALLIAVQSVAHTCMFMTYQPDLPEELR